MCITLNKELGELLAVVHRDGGHYEQEHGTLKAVEDAKQVFWDQEKLIGELDYELANQNRACKDSLDWYNALQTEYDKKCADLELARQIMERVNEKLYFIAKVVPLMTYTYFGGCGNEIQEIQAFLDNERKTISEKANTETA